jgi:hypothetical protein
LAEFSRGRRCTKVAKRASHGRLVSLHLPILFQFTSMIPYFFVALAFAFSSVQSIDVHYASRTDIASCADPEKLIEKIQNVQPGLTYKKLPLTDADIWWNDLTGIERSLTIVVTQNRAMHSSPTITDLNELIKAWHEIIASTTGSHDLVFEKVGQNYRSKSIRN